MEGFTEEQKQEAITFIKEEKTVVPTKKDKGKTRASIEEVIEDELDF